MATPKELFTLTIDPVNKRDLSDAAKWANVVAITAFVILLIAVAGGICQVLMLDQNLTINDAFGRTLQQGKYVLIALYIIILIVSLFPLFYMFRFGSNMRKALATNDQDYFGNAFHHLKLYFRILAILTFISLGLFIMTLVALFNTM